MAQYHCMRPLFLLTTYDCCLPASLARHSTSQSRDLPERRHSRAGPRQRLRSRASELASSARQTPGRTTNAPARLLSLSLSLERVLASALFSVPTTTADREHTSAVNEFRSWKGCEGARRAGRRLRRCWRSLGRGLAAIA